jgi:hypothetical protein
VASRGRNGDPAICELGTLAGRKRGSHSAFRAYRDYGPERNIRKAVEAALGEAERGKVEKRYQMWRVWSTQFRWRKRVADYEHYLERVKLTEQRKTIEAQEAAYRETTGKMLQVISKKLGLMEPGELSNRAVVEYML